MIPRHRYRKAISVAIERSPVCALLGPRQCGKTTLARMMAQSYSAHYFDLESEADRRRLQNPELMLGPLSGLVILDEIQIVPELFNSLRVLVDRPDNGARYLILGSASPQIIKGVSETLAGRIEFVDLAGFDLAEIPHGQEERLWLRGGFPRSFLAASEADSLAWREGFIRTFLERDIPQLGISIPAAAMRRFWTMLAHLHGQTWNASELGRSMGLSDKTVRAYLDILTGTYMVRQLQPWHENIGKRQVKAPKIFLRDSGLLHSLLSIDDLSALLGHPRLGASWEGFALEQVLTLVGPDQAWFWATHAGAELDLLIFAGGKRYGVEFKFSEAPKITKSMHSALVDLNLAHLWVVYPGAHSYPVHDRISVVPLGMVEGEIKTF
ncbi:ATP-binding protein [Desulfurivibrio alkaliphilus]|uniref:AAA family ATPase n=1 Tax=Desulfurivibrio alkaliphilus (strain DSM 19089 / UNIQEM U267 / AHT2) TaxID=589865 RepID=D6Z3H5_DESAT|nr:ATP-binding protein [Desulfurivibrio alkaliphilus]ADH86100.1 AAA family ATPase [Desulfurivibrio alkaliphilus AHT 2]